MNFAFLGRMIPAEMQNTVRELSSHNMQDAANALQWHLYNGLCKNINDGIYLINTLPIGSYPQYYKKVFVKESRFSTAYMEANLNVGFCNVKLIKNCAIHRSVEKALLRWCADDEANRMVFIYTLAPYFLAAVEKAKEKYPSLKACAIVADLPNMASLSSKEGFLLKKMRGILSDSAYAKIGTVDAFVLLTKQMAEYMKISKPYCVVEGISTEQEKRPDFAPPSREKKMIFYSGTLHKRFGVMNLVEAFKLIKDDKYELVMCGVGDSECDIILAASKDTRIRFLGQCPRADVLALQKEATVLVNPRQNNEEFTKYSFPSKNLEYLSSGRPLVAYKLAGIPDEYDNYIYYVDEDSIEALANKLVEICNLPCERVERHCKNAYDFVHSKKNAVEQTRIILDTLKAEGVI